MTTDALGYRGIGTLLSLGVLSAIPHRAAADVWGAAPLPPSWVLTTSVSSHGTFLVSGLDGCINAPTGELLPMGGGASIRTTPVQLGPCELAFVPPQPLEPGSYCVWVEAGWGPQQQCFTVTGVVPVLTSASLSSTLSAEAHGYESCTACDDGSSESCTRLHYRYFAQLRLEGVATEIASSHLFAWSVEQGDEQVATPLPAAPHWKPLNESLSDRLPLDNWTEPFTCMALYARPLGESVSTLLARFCEPRPPQFSFPDAFNPGYAACEAGYAARWCADNLDDCTQLPEHPFAQCGSYLQHCHADGSPKPRPDAGALPPQDADEPSEAADPEPSSAFEDVGGSEPSSSAGCSAASAPSRGWLWLVFVALAGWSALRTRRKAPRMSEGSREEK